MERSPNFGEVQPEKKIGILAFPYQKKYLERGQPTFWGRPPRKKNRVLAIPDKTKLGDRLGMGWGGAQVGPPTFWGSPAREKKVGGPLERLCYTLMTPMTLLYFNAYPPPHQKITLALFIKSPTTKKHKNTKTKQKNKKTKKLCVLMHHNI